MEENDEKQGEKKSWAEIGVKTALFVFPFPSVAYFRRMSEVVQICYSKLRFLLPQVLLPATASGIGDCVLSFAASMSPPDAGK